MIVNGFLTALLSEGFKCDKKHVVLTNLRLPLKQDCVQ